MMKRYLMLTISCLPILLFAQDKGNGIKWAEGLLWQQLKEKAKQENKYIFIDAFATWCGPCKEMDKKVYANDTVGEFFNEKFISVKVQMDKTKNDDSFVQSWYNDVDSFNLKYRIEGYPSFIFFSPMGIIVHKDLGYKTVSELMATAQTAITSGKAYDDPYAEYDRLVQDYKKGIKHFDRMIYMSKTAYKLGDDDFGKQLLNEHTEYCLTLKPEHRYTKESIEYWATFLLGSNRPRFWFFYRDAAIIDHIIGKKGFAESVADRTIQHEIVDSFFKTQPTGLLMTEQTETEGASGKKAGPDYAEADWKRLYHIIEEKYSVSYATRNLLEARLNWYDKHRNYTAYAKYYLIKLEKSQPAFNDLAQRMTLNTQCWNIFLNVTDKKLLLEVSKWMAKVVQQSPKNDPYMLDTYANLLYKAGKKEKAITWQQKAVNTAMNLGVKEFGVKEFKEVLEQMNAGQPTHLNNGAVWQ
jgi:thioredoxin-related protein